jgi:hypothetical protein
MNIMLFRNADSFPWRRGPGLDHGRNGYEVRQARIFFLHRTMKLIFRRSRLVISSGLHQMATGSHTRLMENGWRTKYDEDPCIRRKIVYTLPPPIDGIDLGERIACLSVYFPTLTTV